MIIIRTWNVQQFLYVWVIFRSQKLKNTVKYDIFKTIKKTNKNTVKKCSKCSYIFLTILFIPSIKIFCIYTDLLQKVIVL